jgi:RNA polymerase sigma-70 factor (ECF subfamily)
MPIEMTPADDNLDVKEKHLKFNALFQELYKSLCVYVFNYTKNEQVSEDIVVEVFTSLWQNYSSIRDQAAMRAWLYQVSRNKSFNWMKSRQLQQKKERGFSSLQDQYTEDVSGSILEAEIIAELHHLIHNLPSQCSRIFSKLYIEGKNLKETASELQLSVNTVKSQKHRGLQLLRVKIRPVIFLASLLFLQNFLWL